MSFLQIGRNGDFSLVRDMANTHKSNWIGLTETIKRTLSDLEVVQLRIDERNKYDSAESVLLSFADCLFFACGFCACGSCFDGVKLIVRDRLKDEMVKLKTLVETPSTVPEQAVKGAEMWGLEPSLQMSDFEARGQISRLQASQKMLIL